MILSQARHLISVKRYQQALDLLIAHGSEYIGHSEYFLLIGDCYMQLEKYKLASSTYEEALKIDPNNVWVHLSKVKLKIIANDLIGADMLAESCIKMAPTLPEVYAVKGEVLLRKRAYSKSIKQFDHALQLDPNYAEALELKSLALSLKLNHSEADKVNANALQMDPESAQGLTIRAWNELFQGHQQQAESLFQDALRLDPLDKFALEGYKRALSRKSQFFRPIVDLEILANKRTELYSVFAFIGYGLGFGVFFFLEGSGQLKLLPLLTGLAVYLLSFNLLPRVIPLISMIPLMLNESNAHMLSKREMIVATVALSIMFTGSITLLAAFFFSKVFLVNGLLIILAGIFISMLKEKKVKGLPFIILLSMNIALICLSMLFMYATFQTSPMIVLLLIWILIHPHLARLLLKWH